MAQSHQTGTLSFERLLSSNPLVLLLGAAVSVGTVTAGVMAYLNNERLTDLDIQHKIEIQQIKSEDKEHLLAVTTPLNEKIEDLNFRVTSIERRVPGTSPSNFDITTVMKGSDARQVLGPPRYTSYDNDGFYVAVPPGTWTFEITDELSRLQSTYSFIRAVASQLQGINKAPVFVWQGSSKVRIFPTWQVKKWT